MGEIIIIQCGSKKADTTCEAQDLYTGGLFATNRKYAKHFFPGSWYILSAKHGLLYPQEIAAPHTI